MSHSSESSELCGQRSPPRCHCDRRACLVRSGTTKNPARRFWACCFYIDPSIRCNYFDWEDHKLNDYYRGLIIGHWDLEARYTRESENAANKKWAADEELEKEKKKRCLLEDLVLQRDGELEEVKKRTCLLEHLLDEKDCELKASDKEFELVKKKGEILARRNRKLQELMLQKDEDVAGNKNKWIFSTFSMLALFVSLFIMRLV